MKSHNRILLAMFFAMLVGYMPWYNFSAVLKYHSDEFHLDAADTGFILSAFQAGYVIVVVCIGWLARVLVYLGWDGIQGGAGGDGESQDLRS